MAKYNLGAMESRFADIVWENEPVTTTELIALCSKELDWKRTTTYTVLKRLCDRGIFKTDRSVVTSLMSRDDFYSSQTELFVNETFNGSLPAFIAAFTKNKPLSRKDIDEIQKMIDSYNGKQ